MIARLCLGLPCYPAYVRQSPTLSRSDLHSHSLIVVRQANKRDQLGEYTSWKKRPELLRVSYLGSHSRAAVPHTTFSPSPITRNSLLRVPGISSLEIVRFSRSSPQRPDPRTSPAPLHSLSVVHAPRPIGLCSRRFPHTPSSLL
eukprot:586217-Pleurochrysis_carterae.AAC.2